MGFSWEVTLNDYVPILNMHLDSSVRSEVCFAASCLPLPCRSSSSPAGGIRTGLCANGWQFPSGCGGFIESIYLYNWELPGFYH